MRNIKEYDYTAIDPSSTANIRDSVIRHMDDPEFAVTLTICVGYPRAAIAVLNSYKICNLKLHAKLSSTLARVITSKCCTCSN